MQRLDRWLQGHYRRRAAWRLARYQPRLARPLRRTACCVLGLVLGSNAALLLLIIGAALAAQPHG